MRREFNYGTGTKNCRPAKKVYYRTCPRFVLTNVREKKGDREKRGEKKIKLREKENAREKRDSFFKAFASLSEGIILHGGFIVFNLGAGVAKCQCP